MARIKNVLVGLLMASVLVPPAMIFAQSTSAPDYQKQMPKIRTNDMNGANDRIRNGNSSSSGSNGSRGDDRRNDNRHINDDRRGDGNRRGDNDRFDRNDRRIFWDRNNWRSFNWNTLNWSSYPVVTNVVSGTVQGISPYSVLVLGDNGVSYLVGMQNARVLNTLGQPMAVAGIRFGDRVVVSGVMLNSTVYATLVTDVSI